MTLKTIAICVCIQCLCAAGAYAAEEDIEWQNAAALAKHGQNDFAFVKFDMILNVYPTSKHAQDALFAEGEYYFSQDQFQLAAQEFEAFCAKYPKQQESLAAFAHLYKMSVDQGDIQKSDEYRGRIAAAHESVFIFKTAKHYEFVSGFQHRYKITFYIDKIEVAIDGKPFVTVPY